MLWPNPWRHSVNTSQALISQNRNAIVTSFLFNFLLLKEEELIIIHFPSDLGFDLCPCITGTYFSATSEEFEGIVGGLWNFWYVFEICFEVRIFCFDDLPS